MWKLLRSIFNQKKHRRLLIMTMIAMAFSTIGTQMEAMALAIITNKGPSFFELFAPERDGQLIQTNMITHEQLDTRWNQLDPSGDGVVTNEDAAKFLVKADKQNFIRRVIGAINSVFPISGNIGNLAIFLVCVALFKAMTLFVHRFTTRVIAIRVSRDLRRKYFEHIQILPMSFYQKYNIGTLSSRVVSDSYTIAEAINACLVNYFQTPFTIITTLTLCFLTSWRLSLIVFVGMPMIMGVIAFISRRVKRVSRQIQRNQENFSSLLIDFIAGIQTVKLFGMEGFAQKKFNEQNDQMAKLEQKSARYDLSSRPIVHTLGMFFLATSLVTGLYVFNMTVPEVLFFGILLYAFYEPVKKFAEENSHIQRGIAAAERMQEVLDIKPMITDDANADKLTSFKGPIEFDDVWFKYGQHWVLQGVSFTVEKGQTVAIVGPTGAGKSTIVNLLPRLYDVDKGDIRINGKSISTYTQRSLRDAIGFVPQRPFLFVDTVAENISFGRSYGREQVLAAARQAHADEFICRLPEGYDTLLSETGKNLSGGQQQRLAIARALVKDAPILIMDEATSALDTVSELQIKLAIHQLRGKVTQIIIAHRLSTIEDADKIIYLSDGKKIAEGTKDQLLETCVGFRAMWEAMHQSQRNHE